jgi:hypothetical protein
MHKFKQLVIIAMSLIFGATQARALDKNSVLAAAWQDELVHAQFVFNDSDNGVAKSLAAFNDDSQVDMLYDPSFLNVVNYTFIRDNKPILKLKGNLRPAFCARNHRLYFVDYSSMKTGCEVEAFDLLNGKQLWSTFISPIDVGGHSLYHNSVSIELTQLLRSGASDAVLVVRGKETACKYTCIIGLDDGRQLAIQRH